MALNTNLGVKSFWKSLTNENKWHFLLMLLVLSPFFLPLTRAVFNRIGLNFITSFSDILFWTLAILGSVTVFIKRIRLTDIIFIGSLIVFFYLSQSFYPSSERYCKEYGDFFLGSCLPLYFIGLTVNIDKDTQKLVWVARITILINYVYLLAMGGVMMNNGEATGEAGDGYNMVMSYNALLPTLLISWYALECKILWDYILTFLGIFLILSLGTRGPLVCLLTFFLGYLLLFKHFKYNLLTKAFITTLISLLYFFIDNIALALRGFSLMLGYSTRIYDSILEDTMLNYQESNARNIIHEIIIKQISNDESGFGYGFFADRQFTPSDEYCHNLELELLISFGKIGGGIILFILFALIYKSFKKTYGTQAYGLLFALFCSIIMQLQFSGSYTTTPWFWLYLGISVMAIRTRFKKI